MKLPWICFCIMLGIAGTFAVLYLTHKCKECPACPVITSSHTETKEKSEFKETGDLKKVKVTKVVKPKPEFSYVDSAADPCQEIKDFLNTEFTMQIPFQDSIMTADLRLVIGENQLKDYALDRTYLLPVRTDSVKQAEQIPVDKNRLVVSAFAGNSAAGAGIGYRFSGKQISVDYDAMNNQPLLRLSLDIK